MKKKTAYIVATLACMGIVIVWLGIFSLDFGVVWKYVITGAFMTLIATTWRAITKKPKRASREEAVKNVDYNKEVLIRINEGIEKAKRSRGSEINHDLIWVLENQCTDKDAAQRLIDKYAEAFNKNLISSIENISDIMERIKGYLNPFIEVGIVDATEQLFDQGILKAMRKKSTEELTQIIEIHDSGVYKEETFKIVKFILKIREGS